MPYVSSIHPVYGPQAGGTNITLSGGLLLDEGTLGTVQLELADSIQWQPPLDCHVKSWLVDTNFQAHD